MMMETWHDKPFCMKNNLLVNCFLHLICLVISEAHTGLWSLYKFSVNVKPEECRQWHQPDKLVIHSKIYSEMVLDKRSTTFDILIKEWNKKVSDFEVSKTFRHANKLEKSKIMKIMFFFLFAWTLSWLSAICQFWE